MILYHSGVVYTQIIGIIGGVNSHASVTIELKGVLRLHVSIHENLRTVGVALHIRTEISQTLTTAIFDAIITVFQLGNMEDERIVAFHERQTAQIPEIGHLNRYQIAVSLAGIRQRNIVVTIFYTTILYFNNTLSTVDIINLFLRNSCELPETAYAGVALRRITGTTITPRHHPITIALFHILDRVTQLTGIIHDIECDWRIYPTKTFATSLIRLTAPILTTTKALH